MPTIPKGLILGELPLAPSGAAASKSSRARDFLLLHNIKPHPTRRSVGVLPDGSTIPLSPSQMRALMTEELPLEEVAAAPADSIPARLSRIEAKLDRILSLLSEEEG